MVTRAGYFDLSLCSLVSYSVILVGGFLIFQASVVCIFCVFFSASQFSNKGFGLMLIPVLVHLNLLLSWRIILLF